MGATEMFRFVPAKMEAPKPKPIRPLESRILFTIQETPRLAKSQICRCINGKPQNYCSLKTCYANSRKRGKFRLSPPTCRHSKANIWRIIGKLEAEGYIITRLEKKTDHDQNRGWDWMKVSYSTLEVCFGD